MSFIYITGIAGAGKSEVYKELSVRGLKVYGTDEDQLAGFYDNESGKRLENPPGSAQDRTPEWRAEHTYKLGREVVKGLKQESADQDIFLCGVVANEEEFLDLFDHLIALVVDNDTLRSRIAARTNNNFGKVPHEVDSIMEWQASTQEYYARYNYIQIDATQPITQVVDVILSQT
jgi:shikimate kinase